MSNLLHDLRVAVRGLAKTPSFTLVAMLTLALGIGANTAIVSVVNAVLLKPLPLGEPERLAVVWEGKENLNRIPVGVGTFTDWREEVRTFEELAGLQWSRLNLVGGEEPMQIVGAHVTCNFFRVLRVSPGSGRGFGEEDCRGTEEPVVILDHGFWQRHFGSDPGVLGGTVTLNELEHTVVGIMPPEFRFTFPLEQQVWIPRVFTQEEAADRHLRVLQVVGRLSPGAGVEEAQAEMDLILGQLSQQHPEVYSGWRLHVLSLTDQIVGGVRSPLLLLLGAVGFVLLIATLNVGQMLLARSILRDREIATRITLGVGRWALGRKLLTEALLLTLLAAGIGVLLAHLGIRLLGVLDPGSIPRLDEVVIDGRVLGATLAVSLVVGLVFGCFPILRSFRLDLASSLKEGEARQGVSLHRHRLSGLLIAVETSVVLILLIGTGLMLKSLQRLNDVELGFEPDDRLALTLALSRTKYTEREPIIAAGQAFAGRIARIPGVEQVGISSSLPLTGARIRLLTFPADQPKPPPGQEFQPRFDASSSGFFHALGIPLLRGRLFEERDRGDAPGVVIVNETAAQMLWPGENAVGKRVALAEYGEPWLEVVGVVGDVRGFELTAEPEPAVYQPYAQLRFPWPVVQLVVTAQNGGPAELLPPIRSAIWEVDPYQPITRSRSLRQVVADSVSQQRFYAQLLGIFAAVALLLGSLGIYGSVNYLVTQRNHEIGVRMALGARRASVLRRVIVQGAIPVVIGLLLGTLGALALARVLSSLLFEVASHDPMTFAVVPLLLLAVAMLATYVPARRASKVAPVIALRYE